MDFHIYGSQGKPSLLLLPGLGVSHEIFLPLTACRLESIHGADIHFWYGTKEAFVAKPQVEHLLKLCHSAHIEVFDGMNHGQLLIEHPMRLPNE